VAPASPERSTEQVPAPSPALGGKLGNLNGSTNPASSRLPSSQRRNNTARLLTLLAAALVLIGLVGGAAWHFLFSSGTRVLDVVTHTVKREPLELTIVERGALESSENSDIYCRVKARSQGSNVASSIRSVIDDGSMVKRGQLLVELDDSFLYEQLTAQRIVVDRALSEWAQADSNYEITLVLNDSQIQTAEAQLKLAGIDLTKYVEGDYEQQRKTLQGQIKIAQSNVDQWLDRTAWSEYMFKRGYFSGSQAQAERSKMESAEIDLKRLQEELNLLDKYTKDRFLTDLGSKLELAKSALIEKKKTADSNLKKADTERQAKKRIYDNEVEKLQDIEEEIRKCKIVAPQNGMVVYFIPESSRSFMSSRTVNIGPNENVLEGQRLMRIPNLKKMQVNTRVHEALVSRVHGEVVRATGFGEAMRAALLVTPDSPSRMLAQAAFLEMRPQFHDLEHEVIEHGQQAQIRVDAFPDRALRGHVKSVATVNSTTDFYSSDVKVYTTIVTIDENIDNLNLKPGMSAEVTILADRKPEPVLTIPVDAILGNVTMGRNRKCLVLTANGTEERDIEIGLSNDSMAEVRKGLEEGDRVIRHPHKLLSDADKLRLYGPSGGPAKGGDWAGKAGKGKGKGAGMGDFQGQFEGPGRPDFPGKGPDGAEPGNERPMKGKGKSKGKQPPREEMP
jgi:HlyD family secretion protein